MTKMDARIRSEQEEALFALTDYRTKEIDHLRQRITYYKSQGKKGKKMSSEQKTNDSQSKRSKRKAEDDLIQLIGKKSSPVTICCHSGPLMFSQHKRRLRSLALCRTSDQLFVTIALDRTVNLWEIQGKGSGVHLLSSTNCQSNKQRRWPEDIAWYLHGNKLLSVYSADGGDSQNSVLYLDKGRESTRVSFLQDKPHVKSIINSIEFMPWNDQLFVTGGNDHAVILWTENEEDSWKPKSLQEIITRQP